MIDLILLAGAYLFGMAIVGYFIEDKVWRSLRKQKLLIPGSNRFTFTLFGHRFDAFDVIMAFFIGLWPLTIALIVIAVIYLWVKRR